MKEVIPFALPIRWYPDSPEDRREFRCDSGRTELIYGSLDPDGTGYVYKVRSDSFVKIDQWQWVSETEVTPEEVIEIRTRDYWDTIRFSERAEKIQNEMYAHPEEAPGDRSRLEQRKGTNSGQLGV